MAAGEAKPTGGQRATLLRLPHQQRDDIVVIELVASRGCTDEQKQAAMEVILDEVSARTSSGACCS